MATIFEVANAVNRINLIELAKQVVMANAEPILEENRYQLYVGLRPDGSELTPRYYYRWYAEWKHRLNPAPGFGVPDLFITGALHETLTLSPDTFMPYFDSELAGYPQIAQYQGIFGVSSTFLRWQYAPKVFNPQLKILVNKILQG
jgi:hypothetical protein